MPLLAMKRSRIVDDFVVTNSFLENVPEEFTFDVVWLQRTLDPIFVKFLIERVGSRFIYDIDDLLLGRASYLDRSLPSISGALNCLAECRVLTSTSHRLVNLLERYCGQRLMRKTLICPNGGEFPSATRSPARPTGIIWTSSDHVPLTTSEHAVASAVRTFAERHNLPVYCIGSTISSIGQEFPNAVNLGTISFWHYRSLLASLPGMIGVAPLETRRTRQPWTS